MFIHSTRTYIKGVDSWYSAHVSGRLSNDIEYLLVLILPIIISNTQIPSEYISLSIRTSNFSHYVKFFLCFANGQ